MRLVELAGLLVAVAVGERRELLGMGLALLGKDLTGAQHVGLGAMPVAHGEQPRRKPLLRGVRQSGARGRAASQPPRAAQMEGSRAGDAAAASVTRTAPALKRGCLETGSQLVIVSSLAARPTPSGGPIPSETSQ